MARKAPNIIEVSPRQIQELRDRAASNSLRAEDTEMIGQILDSYSHLFQIVGDKNTTIARLRKLLFGSSTEKSSGLTADDKEQPTAADNDNNETPDSQSVADGAESIDGMEPKDDKPAQGHGRYGAEEYAGAEQVDVRHPGLCAGDNCPECQAGIVYNKAPSVFVRFTGQAPLHATVFRLQRLRCNLCGKIFTAPAPTGMGDQKYDHTVASMIGLLKYGSGLPFNRSQRLQGICKIPLAASTQWEIVQAAALLLAVVYEALIRHAAQGEVVYNDDTTVKILELMGQRAKKSPPPDDLPDRTGIFTSGVVAVRAGRRMAIFFSGRQHAGENLRDVLKHRVRELEAPIQMCDGLSRNIPTELETILANCLAHGRRNFVELYDRFNSECRYVIDALKVVYHNDKLAREKGMSADERLAFHQAHSQATLDNLKQWMDRQFDEKLVEPNSALGEAINYMLRRWDALTLFLRKAGAPLDNNVCERALKKAIQHRKNSLFYKSRNGARVGDIYMSLIYTCELNQANALDYLNQLQLNASNVAEHPERWMPWNYRDHLAAPDLDNSSLAVA
jgi:transposase